VKPSVCKCCGQPIPSEEAPDSRNPNVCFSCAGLVNDVQDNTILESAIPLEIPASTPGQAQSKTPTDPADVPNPTPEPVLPEKQAP
jgi:hypothetical protein